jgi:hypothetical protein
MLDNARKGDRDMETKGTITSRFNSPQLAEALLKRKIINSRAISRAVSRLGVSKQPQTRSNMAPKAKPKMDDKQKVGSALKGHRANQAKKNKSCGSK